MNAHGGNGAAIDAVALRLRMRWRMLAVHASWRRLGYPDGLFSPRETAHGVHGGDSETSLMLAFRPDLVRAGRSARLPERGRGDRAGVRPPARKTADRLRLGGERPQSRGRGRGGRPGDGGQGRGGRAYGVERFIALMRDVQTFDLARLAGGPLEADRRGRTHFDFEREAFAAGCRWVAGVDEVGRGPLAGPVGVAAVILDPDDLPDGLDDSKALTEAQRDALEPVILAKAISVSVAFARRRGDRPLQHPRRDAAGHGAGGRGPAHAARPRAGRRARRPGGARLPGAADHRRRRALDVDRRGLDRGQDHPRRPDAQPRPRLSRLRLRRPRRLRHRPSTAGR